MKIPETSANVGAYYGNEENGQWQPNGVIIDSGVGGGVVGSGDAGIHRPPVYPVHMPRGQMPPAGYVMAGAFYPPGAYPAVPPQPAPQDDFEDYMWMENEEEFDKQVMQQLEEEALMEQCIEAMLEDEQRERNNRPVANGHKHHHPTTSNGGPSLSIEETVSRSTLNPLAAEFVPTRARPTPTNTEEEKAEPPEPPAQEVPQKEIEPTPAPAPIESRADTTDETKTEEPVPPQKDPPEVSAADVQPITEKTQDKRPKDPKKESRPKQEVKKVVKAEVKPKPKAPAVKSETKVQPKKKEVKSVKSEVKAEEKRPEVKEEKCEEVAQPVVAEAPKAQSPPVEESTGPKPINYAAAAKANKPKKPPTPPASDKSTPPPQFAPPPQPKSKSVEKKKVDKPSVKTDKVNVQRKNSTNSDESDLSVAATSDTPIVEVRKKHIIPWWSEQLARLKRDATTKKRRIRCAAPIRRDLVVQAYLQAKEKYENYASEINSMYFQNNAS